MVFFQIDESLLYFLRTLVGESLQVDISHAIVEHPIPRNLIHQDLLAGKFNLARLLLARSLDSQCHLRVGNALQEFAHLVAREGRDIHRVDGENQIPRFQSRLGSRHPLERLDDDNTSTRPALADIGADATVLARYHLFEISHVFLGNILGIRV